MWCLPASDSSVKKIYSNEKENKGNLGPPPQKKSAVAQKINEVEDIIEELKEKHGIKYSIEQLSAWAHVTCRKT